MILRALMPRDMDELRKIHEKHFAHEFPFPDFVEHYLCAAVVLDEDDSIICVGGVKTIVESVLVTNKDKSPRIRREALYRLLLAEVEFTKRFGYDSIHAFIQDEKWLEHLKNAGFRPTKGTSLYLGL